MQFITFMSPNTSYIINFSSKTDILFHKKFEEYVKHESEKNTNTCYFVDRNVGDAHPEKFQGIEKIIWIEGNEDSKSFNNLKIYIQQLIDFNIDKKSKLIGIGGGIVSDIVGFLGSNFKRGIPFGFFPTTVLSSVDAAIGGKNGLNFNSIKNVFGTISQPDFIHYDLAFLSSLKKEDYNDGFAEIIKYGCIADIEILELLEQNDYSFESFQENTLLDLFKKCISIKCQIIEQDPFDSGIRKILNFGHTLGHAIESTLKISHGKSVAIGMMFACFVSNKCKDYRIPIQRLELILKTFNLPTTIDLKIDEIMQKMNHDKKKNATFIDFIFLEKLGNAKIQELSIDDLHSLLIEFSNAKDH